MSRNNVTMIDDLPYLEDLENGSYMMNMNGVPPTEMKQVSKFIRDTTYNPPMESGMYLSNHQQPVVTTHHQSSRYSKMNQNNNGGGGGSGNGQSLPVISESFEGGGEKNGEEGYRYNNHQMHRILSLSCVDIAEHATNCIVCSKLYNTDTTLYVIVIAILLLTVVILMKKVLDLQKS
jgi:hypothetical protein